MLFFLVLACGGGGGRGGAGGVSSLQYLERKVSS